MCTNLPLRREDHECHGDGRDEDADEDVVGERFAEDQRANENGRNGLKHTEDRGFGGADVAGCHGQGCGGNDGRKNGQGHQVEPVKIRLNARQEVFAGDQDPTKEYNRTNTQGVERQQGV